MQKECYDYYNILGECCLNCYDSEPGCLCYDCKCTKCYWYSSPGEYDGEKGHCDKTDVLREEKKAEARERYVEEEKHKFRISQKLEKMNSKILKKLKKKKEIPSTYTCQKCKRTFTTRRYIKIIKNKKPFCLFCEGELNE